MEMIGGGDVLKVGLLVGTCISVFLFLMAYFTQQAEPYSVISGTFGIICLLLAGIVSDSFVNGDHRRANFYTEDANDRKKKISYAIIFFLLGAPNLIVAVLLLFTHL
ncbi:DUF5316 domain-containing protein [Fredinandcohnia humi]